MTNHSIPQAEFRSTLMTQINLRLESEVLRTYHSVLECCVEASTPPARNMQDDSDPIAIWLLALTFERLALAPNQDPDMPINQKVHEGMRLFRSGQIEKLFQMSKEVKTKPPREQAASPSNISRAAQIAMDNNNFSTANARLTSSLPVAVINDSNIEICRELHLPSLDLPDPKSNVRLIRSANRNCKRLIVTPTQIMNILSSLHRAKATGNELDSLDIFVKMATSQNRSRIKGKKTFVKPEILAFFLSRVIQGNLSERIAKIFRTTYMVALRKSETDPTKLRPLGIPSALRRIAAKTIVHLFRTSFAKHLLPFNYAFGENGGMDFIISTVRLGVDKYITQKKIRASSLQGSCCP